MTLASNQIAFPPRSYKNVSELFLPENKHIKDANIESLLVIDEKVHASVEGSKIVEFFNGKSVFLTGGTGFLGKLILEKLLRTCSGIKNFYVLIRPKKGMNADQRMDNTFDNEVFSQLWKAQPKFRHKVAVIIGDMSFPDLGISIEDRQKLIENVNVIIHCAATVRFDERLRTAACINVSGTKGVMSLAQQCQNLVSLVHISTAYSNCVNKEIKEEFYNPPMMTEPFLNMVETVDDEDLDKNEVEILREWPNTYSFTKAIAEHTVKSMANDIPTAVCRPSIVLSTYKEPIKSWIDNFYGPMGVVVGVGIGFLRSVHADPDKVTDIMPADLVSNAIIAAAYQNQFNKKGEIKVYNIVSSAQNPITWADFGNLALHYGLQNPLTKSVWYPCNTINKNKYVHLLYVIFLHFLPALLIDAWLAATGKKARLFNIYKKIYVQNETVSYFSLREWKMINENVQEMWRDMSTKDKEIFSFSMDKGSLNWNHYFNTLGGGIRYYLLKDKMETIPAAKKKYQRLYYIHCALKAVFYFIGMNVLLKLLSIIFRAFTSG